MKAYLLILLLSLLGILLFKFYLSSYFAPTTMGLQGAYTEKRIDYLFIGSSLSRQDLNPKILEDSLGLVFIISYNGNNPYYMEAELAGIFDRNIKVKHLIIEA